VKVHNNKVIDLEEDDDGDSEMMPVEVGVAVGNPGKYYVSRGTDYIYLTAVQWRFVFDTLNEIIMTTESQPLPNPTKKVHQ
jgi:hypothetical protein